MLQKAKKLQKARGDTYLGVDVLLCASLGDPDVKQAIAEAGLSPQQLETAVQSMRGADSKARLSTLPPCCSKLHRRKVVLDTRPCDTHLQSSLKP